MSAGLLALFLFILLALGVADKNWLNTPDKIWSRSPGANNWLCTAAQGRSRAAVPGDF